MIGRHQEAGRLEAGKVYSLLLSCRPCGMSDKEVNARKVSYLYSCLLNSRMLEKYIQCWFALSERNIFGDISLMRAIASSYKPFCASFIYISSRRTRSEIGPYQLATSKCALEEVFKWRLVTIAFTENLAV